MSQGGHQDGIGPLKLALGVYGLVFAVKLAVYFATGVMALLAEALHTLGDILVSGFLLVAAVWSRKAADDVHMFGYGRAQNAGALVAATLFLSFTSYKLYEEAIPRLFWAEQTAYRNLWLAVWVIIGSMVVTAVPLVGLLRREKRGASARAQLMELINDELGLLAALVGTLGIMWGTPLADPIAAIAVATLIAFNGIRLFQENLCFLIGRSPGPEFVARVERLARSVPGVLGVHALRAEYIGPDTVHAGLHVEVEPGLPIEKAERIVGEVRTRVHEGAGPGYCVIQVEAAKPEGAVFGETESPAGSRM